MSNVQTYWYKLKRIAMNDLACTYRSCDYDIHALLYRLWPGMLETGCNVINSIRVGRIVEVMTW